MRPKTDRRSRQGAESRARILEATFEIANEVGYQGTSIAEVSKRSGLPPSSVYWHFADKDALFAEVISHSFDQWRASMPRWDAPIDGSRREAVAERIRWSVASTATSPEFWRLGLMLSLERQPVEPTARRRFLDIREAVLVNLARFWRLSLPEHATAGIEPDGPGDPAWRLARFTLACVDGLFVAAQAEGSDGLGELGEMLSDSLESAALRLAGVGGEGLDPDR